MYILTLRLSIFGDYAEYVPTTDNTLKWTKAFQEAGYEFLPSIIQNPQAVISIPFMTVQQTSTEKRIQFASEKGDIVVRFLAERVDVEVTQGETSNPDDYYLDNLDNLSRLMNVALHALGDIKGNRLAYYTELMIKSPEPDTFSKFYAENNLGISMNNYSGEYAEWSHRFNKRICFNVASKEETINTILAMNSGFLHTVEKSSGKQSAIKGLHVAADINTIAENTTIRFDCDTVNEFYTKAQSVFLDLLRQVRKITM